ncbi:MAG TPA: trypsin-like peptidase domain-containing protein [Gemmataceae bacterium]|nr:trypsin-like peptidase domain-containing protein [Gemmataceae bacterium]
MNPLRSRFWPVAALAALLLCPLAAGAKDSFAGVAEQVNKKCVKLFGAGGFQGLAAYGTGVLVSKDGYILTAASQMLDTQNLRVHLADGRRYEQVRVVVVEPALDVALLKIEKLEKGDELPYYDIAKVAKAPVAQNGDWILAFSNQFEIATRDEPMSVQRGVIAAYSKLQGRKGVFEAPYTGDVYIIDAITTNPGAGGGVITTRKGELVGIIGKELRNTLTDTWINYAVPIQALANFVELAKAGKYKVQERPEKLTGARAPYTGIILVPNVVERTPPFVEEVISGSPASKAGLRPDDLIVYVEGQQVGSIKAFRDLIGQYPPGTTLTLEVRRIDKDASADASSDKLVAVKLTLAEPLTPKAPPKRK